MSGAAIQSLVYSGYALAAAQIGGPTQHYRPSGANTPLASGNLLGSIAAAFDATAYKFSKPNLYGKPVWYALVDGSQLAVGDYLVTANSDTYFVVTLQSLLPIACVQCNRVITLSRQPAQSALGAAAYGGGSAGAEVAYMTAWPASVLQGTKGEKGDSALPGDLRMPWVNVLLPHAANVTILTTDVITDDHGQRYKVSSNELTDMGWRLTAALSVT